ncbi:MAG: aldehyde ferredoxin oxidoreductase C-terminal domain-containing protein [Thermodesulfobacteriota bacterium]
MARIIRINLGQTSVSYEAVPEAYELLGGRSLCSAIITKEVPPECEALGKDNKLVFAPGLLADIAVSSVHRISVGGKSPLTKGIKESNAGGQVARMMARLGIKALIVEGKSISGGLLALRLDRNGVEILEAGFLQGLKASECAQRIKEKHGEHVGMILVGPAGERRLLAGAIILTDKDGVPARFAARGGLGAVMGSKGLKAIIVDDRGTRPVKPRNASAFKVAKKRYALALSRNPVTSEIQRNFGTTAMVDVTQELGGLPTRNFSTGRTENAHKINGPALRKRILERGGDPGHACVTGCTIRSSNIYVDRQGKPLVRSLEYETIVMCGTNCGIDELDDIAEINRFCNEFGLDTIEIGGSLGIAMEAGLLRFGDAEGAKRLLNEIETGTVTGRMMGNGAAITGTVLGVERIPAVKGQMMPGYDPRAIKGHGVTYATSPMGADHTAGMTIREGLDQSSHLGQAESSRTMQMIAVIYDSLGVCLFTNPAVRRDLNLLVDLVNSCFGVDLDLDDLWAMARKTLLTEVEFNRAGGLGPARDRLPGMFIEEVLDSSGTVFDVPNEQLDAVTSW